GRWPTTATAGCTTARLCSGPVGADLNRRRPAHVPAGMRGLFAVLAVTLAVAGCAAQSNGAPAGWPAGHEFWSTSVTENGVERHLPAGLRIKMRLAATDPIVVAQADCNAINAEGFVKPDRIVVTDIASTAMGCLGPAGSQDGFISDLLQA